MPVLVNFYGDSPILANVRSVLVDLGGVEPPSEQLILGHAKILICECNDDQSKHSI